MKVNTVRRSALVHHHEGFHSRKYSPKALGKLIHADLYALYLTAQTSSPYGLCTLSINVRVAATRNKLLDGSFDSYARRMFSKFG
ncbi:hypothetical protein T06_8788 [Trichinella sp. T6]|nr:hypothetical protein T06_8788 [Trichinella sp. T6]